MKRAPSFPLFFLTLVLWVCVVALVALAFAMPLPASTPTPTPTMSDEAFVAAGVRVVFSEGETKP